MMARQTFVKHHVDESSDPFASLQELTREMLALKNHILGRIAADPTELVVLLPAWHALAGKLADTLVDMLRLDPTSLPGRGQGSLQELVFTLDIKPGDLLPLPAAPEPSSPDPEPQTQATPGEYRESVRQERREKRRERRAAADQAEAEAVARWQAIPGTDLEEA